MKRKVILNSLWFIPYLICTNMIFYVAGKLNHMIEIFVNYCGFIPSDLVSCCVFLLIAGILVILLPVLHNICIIKENKTK